MVLLESKFHSFIKLPFGQKGRRSASSTASLIRFRSKILDFVAKLHLESNLTDLKKCFEVIDFTKRAFSEMVIELDYPMNLWGSHTAEEYFSYTLNFLDMLNLINAAVLRLRHSRISVSHTLKLISGYYPEEALHKIFERNRGKRNTQIPDLDSEKEKVVLHGLILTGEIVVLSLGLVLSGLCGECRIYHETRESMVSIVDDSVVKALDLGFSQMGKEMIMDEVKEVNAAIEDGEELEKLEMDLKVMEKGIEGIEMEAENLFTEVFAARNKLLDVYRDELSKK